MYYGLREIKNSNSHHLAISCQMSRKTGHRHANMPLPKSFHKTRFWRNQLSAAGEKTSDPSFDKNSSIAPCMLFRYTPLPVFDR